MKTWESADKTVRKEVIEAGAFSKTPTECSTVELFIEHVTLNGVPVNNLKEKFNSELLTNYSIEKVLIMGESCSEIDRQLERAISMMMVHETSLITILMTTEVFEQQVSVKCRVTLKALNSFKQIWDWTPQEKYEVALKYKEMGVRLYNEARYVDAFHKFSRACKIIITLEPIADLELDKALEDKLNDLRLILYNNMAGCHLHRKNFEHTISLCNKVLDKDKNNIKALYRRGIAHGNLKDVENAVTDLKKVLILDPNNTAAREHYTIYNAKVQEANKKANDIVKRMFKTTANT